MLSSVMLVYFVISSYINITKTCHKVRINKQQKLLKHVHCRCEVQNKYESYH